MYVSSHRFRLPFENDLAPPPSALRSALTFAVIGLLAIGAVLLLGAHGISPTTPCGETFVPVCMAFE